MKLNEIKPNEGAVKNRTRVGRGIGSGKGKTCGSGHKGQKARSGVAIKGFEGGQMPLFRRMPKRGFNNIFAKDIVNLTLVQLQYAFDEKRLDVKKPVTEDALVEAKIIRRKGDGVKLIATGELKAKADIQITAASKGAIIAVEKAGGQFTATPQAGKRKEVAERKAAAAKAKGKTKKAYQSGAAKKTAAKKSAAKKAK